jgi:hypothetical protein
MRDDPDGVHMPQNEVAAKFLSSGHRLLQVDASAEPQLAAFCAERSFTDGLAGEIRGETSIVEVNNRQAAAIHSDAVGDGQRRSEGWSVDSDTSTVAMEMERLDGSDVLDDSSEHVFVGAPYVRVYSISFWTQKALDLVRSRI